MFEQMILPDMGNAISSPASLAGPSPCASHVSPVRQASGPGAPMPGQQRRRSHPWRACRPLRCTKRTGSHLARPHRRAPAPGHLLRERPGHQPVACRDHQPSGTAWLPSAQTRTIVCGCWCASSASASVDCCRPWWPGTSEPRATRGQPLPETFSSPVPAELARWMMGFPPVHAYGNAIDPWAAAEAIRSFY